MSRRAPKPKAQDRTQPDKPKLGVRHALWWAAIVIVAGGVFTLALTGPSEPADVSTPAAAVEPGAVAGAAALASSPTNPRPWQYDPLGDRYWHPAHAHWHPGQPPADAGVQPAPWEYDAKSDQHWDPNHKHWHPGSPPDPSNR